jgi:hypothetical protein
MNKMTLDEAKVVAGKVNELIQSSFVNQSSFTIEDVVNVGLTLKQSKRVMDEFVKQKIVYLSDSKYSAHPKMLDKIKEHTTEAIQ